MLLMKKKMVPIVVLLLIAVAVAAVIITNGYLTASESKKDPFYVGVTFGGDNSTDAKLLIDKVKDCTNLFVVNSGSLQSNLDEMVKTCDYAVNSGLDIIVYFGSYESNRNKTVSFVDLAKERWGSHFLGVYYGDEPSGKAYDQSGKDNQFMRFEDVQGLGNVTANNSGIRVEQVSGSISSSVTYDVNHFYEGQIIESNSAPSGGNSTTYYPNGTVTLTRHNQGAILENLIYLPNGTVLKLEKHIVEERNGTQLISSTTTYTYSPVIDRGNISQFKPYQQLWDSRPFQTMDELSAIAKSYVETQQQAYTNWIKSHTNSTLFTADYVLPWWDYQIGYDTVFAELGWNNTVAQEIGLVRGAANLQNKDWGTIITWKYMQEPYLCSGNEMFEQMKTSYEAGAKYVIVFNYAQDMTGPYGTLQSEHFEALQRFWKDVVQSPWVAHGGVKAEAALVLPADYGWGMRSMNDSIWGIWKPDSNTQQIWNILQNKLGQYGSKLDIVYESSAYPVAGKYSQVIYWNQTG